MNLEQFKAVYPEIYDAICDGWSHNQITALMVAAALEQEALTLTGKDKQTHLYLARVLATSFCQDSLNSK